MKLNQLLSLGLMTAGAAATILPLQRRVIWDNANRTFAIALDLDDTTEAAARAGVALDDLLHELWHAGATHLTVPEDTLARLMAQGRLAVAVPVVPLPEPPRVARWSYLASGEPGLLERIKVELDARQPALDTRLIDEGDRSLLAVSGDFVSLQQVGLGFDPEAVSGVGAIGSAVSIPLPFLLGWLSDRMNRYYVVAFCFLIGALGLFALTGSNLVWHFAVASAAMPAVAASMGISQALVTDLVPPKALGVALALYGAALHIGIGIGLISTGNAIQSFGLTASYIGGAVLTLVAIVVLFVVQVNKIRRPVLA